MTAVLMVATAATATAHPDGTGMTDDPSEAHEDETVLGGEAHHDFDIDGPLVGTDEFDIISGGPYSKVEKNLMVAGRGERLETNVTTDVWAHENYAYTGTFSSDCSDGTVEDESGIWVWDVHNRNNPQKAGVIISPEGTKANDVKVFTNLAGDDILVFSNEVCGAGGVGGVMVYDVSDPTAPEFLSRIQVADANAISLVDGLFFASGLTDSGIHNMFLWSRDGKDYVGVSGEYVFGNFQIFDITDPTAPALVSTYGPEDTHFAERLHDLGIDSFADGDLDFWLGSGAAINLFLDAYDYIFSGYGASANRVMHDLFVNDDGTRAYVNFWDAGMTLLDISDPANPVHISTAIDPTSTDGEVNSHSVWTEDDVIVVEGEEDFAPYATEGLDIAGGPQDEEAFEFAWTEAIATLDTKTLSGPTVYVGLACNETDVPEATADGQVALVLRGSCRFDVKTKNVQLAGYDAIVIFTASPADAPFAGGGNSFVEGVEISIPGVMVGFQTGLDILGVTAGELASVPPGTAGAAVQVTTVWNGWSGLRIWDYSDPENPRLASTFDTACSALEPGTEGAEDCIDGGTYSSHNLVIEDGIAYISWYADGVLMVDVSDPDNPVEVGRYHERGAAFEEQNAGIQDVWGVYKIEDEPWVYASDRNGGLYVLKAYGQGSSKVAKSERTGADDTTGPGKGKANGRR